MPHEVIMPALGMAQDTGRIVSWLKAPGDPVRTGDPLFEVETDKATMEVEAPADGFLTDVQADANTDVPVGNVIALISESAEDSGIAADAPAAAAQAGTATDQALPEGANVIMPALGMAQDSGVIVAWHKAAGDAVSAGDILFEVETDKATMEVEAGHDGYVAALLALASEEAPVGSTIAIITADKPAAPIERSLAEQSAPASPSSPAPAKSPTETAKTAPADKKPVPTAAPSTAPVAPGGRVLASPKARRLALEQGLDLNRLVEAGYPQPYHVGDLDTLRTLPASTAPGAAMQAGQTARHLTARASGEGFAGFADWASEHIGLSDVSALLAGLAGASLGMDNTVVAVESFDQSRHFTTHPRLRDTAETDAPPALRVRDLRSSGLTTVQMGAEDVPVLSILETAAGLTLTLECAPDHLSAGDALSLLSNFAGRMEQPLRHLL